MHNHLVPPPGRVGQGEAAVRSIASVNNETTNVSEAEQRRAARKRFQAQYRALYDELLEILFQLDPIGVHRTSAEKFVPELATILPRLRDARSPEDVEQIIQQELRRNLPLQEPSTFKTRSCKKKSTRSRPPRKAESASLRCCSKQARRFPLMRMITFPCRASINSRLAWP